MWGGFKEGVRRVGRPCGLLGGWGDGMSLVGKK